MEPITALNYLQSIEDLHDPLSASETFISVESTKELYRIFIKEVTDENAYSSYSQAAYDLGKRLDAKEDSIIITFMLQCDREDKIGKTLMVAFRKLTSKFSFSARTLATTPITNISTLYKR